MFLLYVGCITLNEIPGLELRMACQDFLMHVSKDSACHEKVLYH